MAIQPLQAGAEPNKALLGFQWGRAMSTVSFEAIEEAGSAGPDIFFIGRWTLSMGRLEGLKKTGKADRQKAWEEEQAGLGITVSFQMEMLLLLAGLAATG